MGAFNYAGWLPSLFTNQTSWLGSQKKRNGRKDGLLLDFEFGVDCIVVARALFRFAGRGWSGLGTES